MLYSSTTLNCYKWKEKKIKQYLKHDSISYPLFVHVIRKDIYGGVPYHMRPEAECDTAPHHRYLPYCVEQTGDNEFII